MGRMSDSVTIWVRMSDSVTIAKIDYMTARPTAKPSASSAFCDQYAPCPDSIIRGSRLPYKGVKTLIQEVHNSHIRGSRLPYKRASLRDEQQNPPH